LYHTLDPAPFREKALATDAERYIVDQAEELSKAAPIEIMIHLANAAPSRLTALDVASAIAQHFLVRSEDKTRELRALLKTDDGRLSSASSFSRVVLPPDGLRVWFLGTDLFRTSLGRVS
jgi:hypothetical protein